MMESFSRFTGVLIKSLKKSSSGGEMRETQVSFFLQLQGHSQACKVDHMYADSKRLSVFEEIRENQW